MTERGESVKGENIYLRRDGRWEARYIKSRNPEGRAIYGSVYGHTKEEAARRRRDTVERLNTENMRWEGERVKEIYGENRRTTFSQTAEAWFDDILPGIKESTAAKYRNMLCRYILPALGEQLVSSIDAREIRQFCAGLLRSGGGRGDGLSEKTVADILSLIRGILRYASARGQAGTPDLSGVHIRQPKKQMRIFTVSEQKRLTDYLCSHRDVRNLGVLISLYMGLRIGEVCALKWEDISFAERTLQVRRTMQRVQRMRPEGKKRRSSSHPRKARHPFAKFPFRMPCFSRYVPITAMPPVFF